VAAGGRNCATRHPSSLADKRSPAEKRGTSATLLEIAAQLGADPSVQNTVRFAFFGDEENGAVGSTAYVEGLSAADRKKIKLYLNVDMVASSNGGYFVRVAKAGILRKQDLRGRPPSRECSPTSWPGPA
jgi:aminopeptidase S